MRFARGDSRPPDPQPAVGMLIPQGKDRHANEALGRTLPELWRAPLRPRRRGIRVSQLRRATPPRADSGRVYRRRRARAPATRVTKPQTIHTAATNHRPRARVAKRSTAADSRSARVDVRGFDSLPSHCSEAHPVPNENARRDRTTPGFCASRRFPEVVRFPPLALATSAARASLLPSQTSTQHNRRVAGPARTNTGDCHTLPNRFVHSLCSFTHPSRSVSEQFSLLLELLTSARHCRKNG